MIKIICKLYNKNLILLLSFLIIFTSITPIFSATQIKINTEIKENKNCTNLLNDYIIQFTNEPVLVYKNNLIKNIQDEISKIYKTNIKSYINQQTYDYKTKIKNIQNFVLDKIKNIIDDRKNIDYETYDLLFNGMTIKNIPDNLISKIEKIPFVKKIFPNKHIKMCIDESVEIINADDVWDRKDVFDRNITGKDIKIAILDTGVDYTHPDLSTNYLGGYDFANEDDDPIDDQGHGTHVAGIIAGTGVQSNYEYIGVAPDAKYYAFKVLNNEGEGYFSWYYNAMNRAMDPNNDGDISDHVDIISISFGDYKGNPDDPFSQVADNAVKSGAVVVAAAGNVYYDESSDETYTDINSPGCARKVISVGATDKYDNVCGFSLRGPSQIGQIKPDVVAPGNGIVSALASGTVFGYSQIDSYYTHADGTSMACPHVTGVVALILQNHPDWSPDEIKMALRNKADDIGYDINIQGYGRVNAYRSALLQNSPPVAIINSSGNFDERIISILGTADGRDFSRYDLYYETASGWNFICGRDSPVNNGSLALWSTEKIYKEEIKLKLRVSSSSQISEDIVYIYIPPNENELDDDLRLYVSEKQDFIIKSKEIFGDNYNSLFIFTFRWRIPQISYGRSANFSAPVIKRILPEYINGSLFVIKFEDGFLFKKYTVTVINSNNVEI